MKQLRFWWLLPAICLLAMPVTAGVATVGTLSLGNEGPVKVGDPVSVDLTLDSSQDVEGCQVAFGWDGNLAEATGFTPSAQVAAGDFFIANFLPAMDFYAIGIAIDDNNTAPIVLPAGVNVLGSAGFNALNVGTANLSFVDFAHSTNAASPSLENILVIGGLSINSGEGLVLVDGSIEIVDCLPRLFVDSMAMTNSDTDPTGCAAVLFEVCEPAAGVQAALAHDSAELQLDSIQRGSAVSDPAFAEFFGTEINVGGDGGTVGIILDAESPFDVAVRTLGAPGVHEIALFCYTAINPPDATVGASDRTTPLSFVGTLGSPAKENMYVDADGNSVSVPTEDGSFLIKAVGVVVIPQEDCNNGIDDDEDGFIDGDDTDCQQAFACGVEDEDGNIVDATGKVGGTVEICFFIKSPSADDPGTKGSEVHVQGFSMALKHDCNLEALGDLDISDTILEAIGVEFVSTQRDSDGANGGVGRSTPSGDGDGCEIIIGVLLDAIPPFEGQTLPPLDDFQKIGGITFGIADNPALCDTCLDIQFCDGLNGTESVPVKNLISVNNTSKVPQFNDCRVCVNGEPEFIRGDCNGSGEGMGMAVNIADAAGVVSFLFPTFWVIFEPPCLDACDCNDDGRVDLADTFCILSYLFQGGSFPPPPGPSDGPGSDPTHDVLGCDGEDICD